MLTNFNMFPLLEFDICRIFWKILFLTVLMLFFGVSQVGENQDEAKMIDVKKVPSCPYTKEKWLKDATAKNCSSKNVTFKYHCLLDHWRNQSFVFCGEDKRIIGFYCPEYDETRGRIRENYKMKCIELNPPCPIKYNSSDVFKYPDCIKSNIINTSNTTTKEKIKENIDYSKADWLIAVMFLMVYPFLLFTMTVVHLFLYRRCNRRIRDYAEPSFQDFKLSSMMEEEPLLESGAKESPLSFRPSQRLEDEENSFFPMSDTVSPLLPRPSQHIEYLETSLSLKHRQQGHSVVFSQPIEVIENLPSLFIKYIHPRTSDFSFASELLLYVKFLRIMLEVKFLSREVTLNNTFETTTESHEPGKVYVAEVTVTCEKKQLIVKPKVSSFCL